MGDLGGLAIAFRAYKLSLKGKRAPVIDGLTGEQRFFMGWAQIWRSKERDEYVRSTLQTDRLPAGVPPRQRRRQQRRWLFRRVRCQTRQPAVPRARRALRTRPPSA